MMKDGAKSLEIPLKVEESPDKSSFAKGGLSKEKDVEGLCEALAKVDVKRDEGFTKPISIVKPNSVVDDNEKKEYERQSKLQGNEKSPPSSKRIPQVQNPQHTFKIPRDWACYSKCGEVVPTTPFLPFKTPLSEERFTRRPHLEKHTIISLIQDLSSRGIRLTTVIDLTLTSFYDTEILEAFGIRYEKIPIDNHEPRWNQIKKFLKICDDFANEQNKRNCERKKRQKARRERGEEEEYYMYEVIGVHCTRGVNRTGYMVCRAMIERMNYSAEQAVELFNKARGHEMSEFMPQLKRAERSAGGKGKRRRREGTGLSQRTWEIQDIPRFLNA